MKCPKCGTDNKDTSRICRKCGTRLINPKDDSFAWADEIDFTKGIEDEPGMEQNSRQIPHPPLEEYLKDDDEFEFDIESGDAYPEETYEADEQNAEEYEDELGQENEPLVYNDDYSDEEDEEDFDNEYNSGADVPGRSIQKSVMVVLVGCLAVVLIAMAVIGMGLLGRNDDASTQVAVIETTMEETFSEDVQTSSTAEAVRRSTDIISNLNPVPSSEQTATASETAAVPTTETTTEVPTAPVTTPTTKAASTPAVVTAASTVPTTTVVPTVPTTTAVPVTEPTTASAVSSVSETVNAGGVIYEIKDSKATLTRYTGTAARLELPSSINGAPLTFIAQDAFKGNTTLQQVQIPEGVLTVGEDAFYGCSSLSAITIPDSMVLIGEGAFNYCSKFIVYCNQGTYAQKFCEQWNVTWTVGSQLP